MHLTLLAQRDGLAASLTDLKLLARLESVVLAGEDVARFRREFQSWTTSRAAAASPSLREAGARAMAHLLPQGIAQLLRDAPGGPLNLQLDPSLAWVPWELLWDGESFLGEKFQVCRRILADAAPVQAASRSARRGALKVLVVAGGEATAPAVAPLNASLRSMAGLAVSVVRAGDLPRSDLLRLIGSSDVVHYLGPVDGRPAPANSVLWWRQGEPLDLSTIVALEAPALLLVSQESAAPADADGSANEAVALGACRLGLNLLTCGGCELAEAHEFMRGFYAELARGAPIAEAVRSARAAFRQQAGEAALATLRPQVHGDGAAVLNERRASVEDSLRQVTIVSMDLAGSTRLMGSLGAERYSELLTQYHQRCDEILRAHGGSPDDFQGDDGAMCYFGTPVAREDAAAQALQASLQLIEAVQALGLGMRIGVCTGQVVVRDGQPVGPAIHLAARLQSIAAPGSVVVGESTRRIVKERFRFQLLEEGVLLKGFDGPQVCHRLLGPAPSSVGERAGEAGSPAVTPLVGRRDELTALQAHWAAAEEGSLRIVRILGEAGIGKSRLVREFKQLLVAAGHEVFESRCLQEHANSAFHPVIQSLRKELRVAAGDPPEVTLARLRAVVSRAGALDGAAAALLGELLSLPVAVPHPVLEQSAERRRQLTVDLLVTMAMQRVRDRPGCIIVEDIHWLDPSTAELLDRVATAMRGMPLLLVVTARSDADLRWRPRLAVYEAEVQGLSPEQSRSMVLSACGERRLPRELVQLIAARADGVPLFIEESARMALDLSAGRDTLDVAAMPVPSTVLDLLTARLDRLGAAKQVAQAGGTIGREFPLPLLQAVLEHPDSPIRSQDLPYALRELVRAGMLFPRDDDGAPRFVFRHQLMRDAAYGSLLERDRLRLHQVIGGVLAQRFGALVERQPELLAFHYTEAGMDAEALRHWDAAARKAAARSAHAEAIGYVGNALAVLARMPASEDLLRLELRLQLLLASRLIATRGYGAERVERAYARAMELATSLGDESAVMRVLLGLEGYHFMRADFEKARSHALEAARRAGESGSAIQRVQTQWALANIRMHQGDMMRAVQEMDACRANYMRLEHRPEAVQDPGIMCLCYSAWSLWELGYPDEARKRVTDVVTHAEQIRHQFSLGEAYGFRAAVLHFRGENREALESAQRAVAICEEHGFAVWLAHARVMRGRIAADLGDVAAGVEEMRQGYELWAATGAVVTTPFYLAMRAEGCALDDRPEDGLALLEHALAIVERTGERYYEAEVRRLIGKLTLHSALRAGLDREAEAEGWLQQALECARSRELWSLALRAALDLAGLQQSVRGGEEARAALDAACRAIHGGEGTRDVFLACGRLQEMSTVA
jgi:class 3 adenylate cyclase/predicted ATPase